KSLWQDPLLRAAGRSRRRLGPVVRAKRRPLGGQGAASQAAGRTNPPPALQPVHGIQGGEGDNRGVVTTQLDGVSSHLQSAHANVWQGAPNNGPTHGGLRKVPPCHFEEVGTLATDYRNPARQMPIQVRV